MYINTYVYAGGIGRDAPRYMYKRHLRHFYSFACLVLLLLMMFSVALPLYFAHFTFSCGFPAFCSASASSTRRRLEYKKYKKAWKRVGNRKAEGSAQTQMTCPTTVKLLSTKRGKNKEKTRNRNQNENQNKNKNEMETKTNSSSSWKIRYARSDGCAELR